MDLRQQIFHPVCRKCNLRVYLNIFRGVGIRSGITWRENFLNIGGKISTCFLKLHSTCPKEPFELKSSFWKFSFFSNSSELWTNIYCAWRESFWQGYQNWKMQFSSHKIYQKIKLLKVLLFSFFSDSSELRTNNYRARRKIFRQGYQKWKLQSSSQKINQKTKLLENLFFLQILQNFERTFTVLGEKLFGRDIKIEKCSVRLERSIKKPNFWKFAFFSISSELWTNLYSAWRKTFRQGYQNWKLYSMSSEYHFEVKNKFLKV